MPQIESSNALPPLPRSVQDIADVIGRDLALHLIAHLPRTNLRDHPSGQPLLYVPRVISVDHRLVQIIGIEAAQKLVRAFSGEILYPAVCRGIDRAERDREILRFMRMKRKASEVATWFGISERQVFRILARADMTLEDRIAS